MPTTTTPEHDKRVAEMKFAGVYPHYVTKVESKGRSVEELHEAIGWLTGYTDKDLKALAKSDFTFKQFFQAAKLHPKAKQITGVICGYRSEDITTPLTRKCRYLDKVVDELAKGRAMKKIKRSAK